MQSRMKYEESLRRESARETDHCTGVSAARASPHIIYFHGSLLFAAAHIVHEAAADMHLISATAAVDEVNCALCAAGRADSSATDVLVEDEF